MFVMWGYPSLTLKPQSACRLLSTTGFETEIFGSAPLLFNHDRITKAGICDLVEYQQEFVGCKFTRHEPAIYCLKREEKNPKHRFPEHNFVENEHLSS